MKVILTLIMGFIMNLMNGSNEWFVEGLDCILIIIVNS